MSFAAKGNFVNVTGMAGFAMWEAGGDDKNMLLDSISAYNSLTAEKAQISNIFPL